MKKYFCLFLAIICMVGMLASCGGSSSNYSTDYDSDYDSDYGEGYDYDSSDPYYSENDHNHDGKISDSEFQDAMGDLLDDLDIE